MSEQSDVIGELGSLGVLGGVRWAYLAATTRVRTDYSDAAGYDAAWLGISRFTLFRDRLDRVFSCGRYALPVGSDGALSLDVLFAELSDEEAASMPHLPPDLVRRADLNASPGWGCGGWRWLLASAAYGEIDELPWPQKSPTKQEVARLRAVHPDQVSIFDDPQVLPAPAVLGEGQAAAGSEDVQTLVVAHSQDVDHGQMELVLGRPRFNEGGGAAWHWRHDLLRTPPSRGGRGDVWQPVPLGPNREPDADVRLRRSAASDSGNSAGAGA